MIMWFFLDTFDVLSLKLNSKQIQVCGAHTHNPFTYQTKDNLE